MPIIYYNKNYLIIIVLLKTDYWVTKASIIIESIYVHRLNSTEFSKLLATFEFHCLNDFTFCLCFKSLLSSAEKIKAISNYQLSW